ncbi:MAG: hypothetical protein ABSE20_18915 [Acetobacteraceae bacterium]|jgi:hypothetical protein
MPSNTFITAKRRRPAIIAIGFILTATLALGSFSGSARAEGHDRDRGDHHRYGDRGYYRAPPVVYGTPYYAPPVVYGSPFGLNINIR